jgi:hypothetical protein
MLGAAWQLISLNPSKILDTDAKVNALSGGKVYPTIQVCFPLQMAHRAEMLET